MSTIMPAPASTTPPAPTNTSENRHELHQHAMRSTSPPLSRHRVSTNQPSCSMLQMPNTTSAQKILRFYPANRAGMKGGSRKAYTSAPYPHLSTAMRAATICPTATTPSSKMPFGGPNHHTRINRLKLASAPLNVLRAALASGLFLLSHKSRL